ncbi:MAG: hypothetical protein NTX38_04660 [Methylobacter sp.]|nr:hypothetical protein [Methylobacter sp.]
MNKAQLKCLAVFAVFAVIGFGPVSPGCLIGMYVVIKRPHWFSTLVDDLYGNPMPKRLITSNKVRIKAFLCLLTLFILDIAPVPVTPVVAVVIILSRPQWFLSIVKGVYNKN